MGRTNSALSSMLVDMDATVTQTMKGMIGVLDKQENDFTSFRGVFREEGYVEGTHVEMILLSKLNQISEDFSLIPNNSNVVIRCTWSPCKKCAREIPGTFFSHKNIKGKNVKLKFRFTNYYSLTSWTFPATDLAKQYLLYPDDNAAQNDYNGKMAQYGSVRKYKTTKRMEFVPAVTQIVEKDAYNLVIAPYTLARTSTEVDVYEI